MITYIIIRSNPYLRIHRLRDIFGGNNGAGKMVVEPFLVKSITLAAVAEPPITIFFLFVLLVVAFSVRVMQRSAEAPIRGKAMMDS